MRTSFKNLAVLTVLLTLAYAGPANAYVDPGTGSMILQGLIAALAGTAVALRLYWGRVKKLMASIFPSKDVGNADSDAPDET